MKNFLSASLIVLFASSSAFAASTSGEKPVCFAGSPSSTFSSFHLDSPSTNVCDVWKGLLGSKKKD